MKKQHDHLHLSSKSGAPQESPCGAQMINTGSDKSRKQMNITCRWILFLTKSRQMSSNLLPQPLALLDRRFVGAGADNELGLCVHSRTGGDTQARPSDTSKSMCSGSCVVQSETSVETTRFAIHADRRPSVSWSHQHESDAGSSMSSTSLETVTIQAIPASNEGGDLAESLWSDPARDGEEQ